MWRQLLATQKERYLLFRASAGPVRDHGKADIIREEAASMLASTIDETTTALIEPLIVTRDDAQSMTDAPDAFHRIARSSTHGVPLVIRQ